MFGDHQETLQSGPAPNATGQPRERTGRWATFDRWWLLLLAVILVVAGLAIFIPDPYGNILAFIADGVPVTLKLTVVSFVFILIVGMLMGLLRVSGSAVLRLIASLYVEIVRGIPVLVWLLWIYFGLSGLLKSWIPGFTIPDFTAAVIGFTVAYGAYMTEVFRAGIQSIAKGQMEASRSLGMTYVQAMRYIIVPQAIRVILPPMGNEFVTLLKDSSLVSVLAVSDLTRRGRELVARNFLSFETFSLVALTYLILTLFFTRLTTAAERSMSKERR